MRDDTAAVSASNPASDALMQVQVMAEVTATALTEVQAIASATRTALEASWVALAAWTNVLHLTVQPLVRLAVIAWPSVRDSAITGARLAAAQPRTVIAIEAAVIVAVLLLWRAIVFVRRRRYISRARSAVTLRWERLEAPKLHGGLRMLCSPDDLDRAACSGACFLGLLGDLARDGLTDVSHALAFKSQPC